MNKVESESKHLSYIKRIEREFSNKNMDKAESVLDEMFGSIKKISAQNDLSVSVIAMAVMSRCLDDLEVFEKELISFPDEQLVTILKELAHIPCFAPLLCCHSSED